MAAPPLIYVLNGPNLNLLGLREPEIYGTDTLDDIAARLEDRARELDVTLDIRQSNHEGHLIDWLQEARLKGAKAVILNAGGFSHSSVALHDGEGDRTARDRGAPVQPASARGIPPPLFGGRGGTRINHWPGSDGL